MPEGAAAASGQVFVSYSSVDRDRARQLVHGLRAHRLDVFFDESHLHGGDAWRSELGDAIGGARAFVVLLGTGGLKGIQAQEVELALARAGHDDDFRVITVLLPGAPRAGRLIDWLNLRTWVDAPNGFDEHVLLRVVDGVEGLAQSPVVERGTKPYPGLRPFGVDDTELFFGRTRELDELVRKIAVVRRDGERVSRLVAIIGPSGVGKSSLLLGGLLGNLARLAELTGLTWSSIELVPDTSPGAELEKAFGVTPDAFRPDRYTERIDVLSNQLRSRVGRGHGVVLAIDQFEQVLTRCDDAEARRGFLDNVLHLSRHGPEHARVVITLRADHLGALNTAHRELAACVAENPFLLGPLSEAGLREAIEAPAHVTGMRLEPGLVDRILADVQDEPNALPLLALALEATWERAESDVLTLAAYEAGGGVRGALVTRASRALADRLIDENDQRVRTTLLRLVHLGPDGRATRARVRRRDLREQADPTFVDELIDALVGAGLAVTDDPAVQGQVRLADISETSTVELTHDTILVAWPRLAGWIEALRSQALARQRLTEAARTWDAAGRPRDRLASASELGDYQHAAEAGLRPTAVEGAFLAASEQAGRRRHVLRLGAIVLAVLAIAAVALAGVAEAGRRNEEQAAARATAGQLAADAVRELPDRPDTALLLAVEASLRSGDARVRSALAAALTGSPQARRFWSTGAPATAAAIGRIGNDDVVVVGRTSGRLDRCDAAAAECRPIELPGAGSVDLVRVRPNDSVVVVTGDGTVSVITGDETRVVDRARRARTGDSRRGLTTVGRRDGSVEAIGPSGSTPLGHVDGEVSAVALDPLLRFVVAASDTGAPLTLFSIGRGFGPVALVGPTGGSTAPEFTEDGRWLLAGDANTFDLLVWDVAELADHPQATPRRLPGHRREIAAIATSGNLAVTLDGLGEARRWDVSVGTQLGGPMAAHTNVDTTVVSSKLADGLVAGFTHGGEAVALVRADGVVAEWSTFDRTPLLEHDVTVTGATAVAVSRTKPTIAVGGADGTVRLLDGTLHERSTLRTTLGPIDSIAFTGDERLVAGGEGGLVVVEDPTGRAGQRQVDVTAAVSVVAGDRTGAVYAGLEDGTVLRWSPELDEPPRPLLDLDRAVGALAVTPDGEHLAAGELGQGPSPVHLLDVHSGDVTRLVDHRAEVNALAFDPTGRLLVSGGDDRTIDVWEVASGTLQRTLLGHRDRVVALAVEEGTGVVLSASEDESARLWDGEAGIPIGAPVALERGMGRGIATGAGLADVGVALLGDRVVVVALSVERWRALACDIVGRSFHEREWRQYSQARQVRACSEPGTG